MKWYPEKRGLKGWVTASHLSWPISSAHTSPPSCTFPAVHHPFPCILSLLSYLDMLVAPKVPCRSAVWQVRRVIYLWGTVLTKHLPSPFQPPQRIRCADPHVLLWQRPWAAFWELCTSSTYEDLPSRALRQHSSISPPCRSISLVHALHKSSMLLKSCRELYTSLDNLRAGKRPRRNHKTQIAFRKNRITES